MNSSFVSSQQSKEVNWYSSNWYQALTANAKYQIPEVTYIIYVNI